MCAGRRRLGCAPTWGALAHVLLHLQSVAVGVMMLLTLRSPAARAPCQAW